MSNAPWLRDFFVTRSACEIVFSCRSDSPPASTVPRLEVECWRTLPGYLFPLPHWCVAGCLCVVACGLAMLLGAECFGVIDTAQPHKITSQLLQSCDYFREQINEKNKWQLGVALWLHNWLQWMGDEGGGIALTTRRVNTSCFYYLWWVPQQNCIITGAVLRTQSTSRKVLFFFLWVDVERVIVTSTWWWGWRHSNSLVLVSCPAFRLRRDKVIPKI